MKRNILALFLALAGLCACYKAPQPDEVPQDSLYVGTVSVDYDGGVYDNPDTQVACIPSADGKTADIVIYKIKFVPRMPIRIDVTIPGVKVTSLQDGLQLSCHDVTPLAMGGEYPKYQVYNLQGSVIGNKLSRSLLFGEYPTRFSGTR